MLGVQLDTLFLFNLVSFVWFLAFWVGYARVSRLLSARKQSLSSILHIHRINWMRRLLTRSIRMTDAALIANLERNVNFFASSCVLVLAGLLTALSVSEEIQQMLESFALIDRISILSIEVKILTLIGIFVYGFFTFTWSMRQFGFLSVLLGAAPMPEEPDVSAAERRSFAIYAARVLDLASYSYNNGLRSFYFSLAVLSWFIGPAYFMLSTSVVVLILYYREFRSKSLQALAQTELVSKMQGKTDEQLYLRSKDK